MASVEVSFSEVGSLVGEFKEHQEEVQRAYPLPQKDKPETNRLDGQHAIFTSRLGGLYLTPFPAESSPPRVLDVGCGTGIWTRAFAAAHPSSSVVGVDLNPPAERFVEDANVPDNCIFVKGDFFRKWDAFAPAGNNTNGVDTANEVDANAVDTSAVGTTTTQYDFVYMRMLMAAVSDWPALLKQAFENIVPGGRLELFEGLMEMNAEDGSTAENSAGIRWFQMGQRYMAAHNVKWNAALDLPEQLREAGFEEIEDHPIKMRLYKDGDEESWVGKDYSGDMAGLVDGMGKRLRGDPSSTLTEGEWDELERDAKRELLEDAERKGFYTLLHVFLAKKPSTENIISSLPPAHNGALDAPLEI